MIDLDEITTSQRALDIRDAVAFLQAQDHTKVDAVLPLTHVTARRGHLVVKADVVLDDRGAGGVTQIGGTYRISSVCMGDLATKLGVPVKTLRRWHETRTDIFDEVINRLIHGCISDDVLAESDPRNITFRAFRSEDPATPGIARALLSDSYKIIDNLPVLSAVIQGVRRAGLAVEIPTGGCNITDSRMIVDFVCPEVGEMAPILLGGYRTVFDGPNPVLRAGWTPERARAAAAAEGKGYEPGTEPVIWSGFRVSNDETGGGAFRITPRIVAQICRNGLQITQDVSSAIHLGSRNTEGLITWTEDTRAAELEVMTSRTADVVASFLSRDYLRTLIAGLEARAGKPVTDATQTVKAVTEALEFDEAVFTDVLEHFLACGQRTAGGLLNAWTSAAQVVADPIKADRMEATAIKILDLV